MKKGVFTLVHGTFAKDAHWTRDGSALRASVIKACGTANAVFRPFEWSGKNSLGERRKAALRLETHLANLIREFPNDEHFVIAHSHGGNIVLYALANTALRSRLAGVVCLSTPFLSVALRPKHEQAANVWSNILGATVVAFAIAFRAFGWGFTSVLIAIAAWVGFLIASNFA